MLRRLDWQRLGIKTRLFWADHAIGAASEQALRPFFSHQFADLYLGDGSIVKFCKPQSRPKDILRKYAGNSQAHREMAGARRLRALGIKTPTPFGAACSLNPLADIESVYAMEYIGDTLPPAELAPDDRQAYHCRIVADLQKMRQARLLFKDLRFHNILFTRHHDIVWIDTDTKTIADRDQFEAAFAKSLKRLLAASPPETVAYFASQLDAR